MIGKMYTSEIAQASKSFCEAMSMNTDQKKEFEKLIKLIITHTINTSTQCANAVGGIRQIKNNLN